MTPAPTPLAPAHKEADPIERLRLERILRGVLPIGIAACLIAMVLGAVTHSERIVWMCLPGAIGFALAYVPARRGNTGWAAWIIVVTATALVTVSGTTGAGLHDPGVLAYPVIVVFGGMTLDGRRFFTALSFVALSMTLLVSNEYLNWSGIHAPAGPPWAEGVIAAIIMAATAWAVWMLASTARDSLLTAQREIEQRKIAEAELHALSTQDFLTGAFNRRYFDAEVRRLRAGGEPIVSVIVADLDGLKAVNDRLGHEAGDELVVRAASLIASVIRAEDVLARMGGDEFAVLLPGADETAAAEALARIERRLADDAAQNPYLAVRLSLGTATAPRERVGEAFTVADARMYQTKLTHREAQTERA